MKKATFNYDSIINNYKPTDCGRWGKAFEINVKRYLNGNRGNAGKVSAKGKNDLQYHGKILEVKSNCGSFLPNIVKNDFIVYTYDAKNDWNTPSQARVIPTSEFLAGLEELGLLRTAKKSTNCQLTMAIQSYANSNKKMALWAGFIDKYPTLEQWKAGA